MRKIIKNISSTGGRNAKFIGGAIISSAGLFISPILVVVGILPLLTAIFDLCIIAPIFGLPPEGEKLREILKKT